MYVQTYYPEMVLLNLFIHLRLRQRDCPDEDQEHCQCFTGKGQLARNNTPFPIFMRTRLIHPKRSFVPRHSVISPHDDTLSFCSYGLLHCMCIGTNFSTWIKHADEVFLNHSGIPYFKAHLPSIKRGRGVLETNDGYILF